MPFEFCVYFVRSFCSLLFLWSLLHFFDAVSLVFYGYVLVFAHVALLVAVVFLFFLFLAAVVDALTTPSSLYLNVFNFFF